jgi:hypothetical protein
MNEQGTEKRKSPVTVPVRNNETTTDFANISDVSTGTIAKGGRGVFKIQKKLYGGPGTVKRERRSAGAAEIFKMVRYAAVEGRDIRWGGENV